LNQWELTDRSAVGTAAAGRIEVIPTAPNQFTRITAGEYGGSGWDVLAVRPLPGHAMLAEEIYVRERDLIARFGQSESDEYAFQLDWQLLSVDPPFLAGVELWLSIQTSLLDARPALEVICRSPDALAWHSYQHDQLLTDAQMVSIDDNPSVDVRHPERGPAALVCQAASAAGLWLIEPSDQCHVAIVSADGDVAMRLRLFGHFMEKGVIRRARMRFLVANGELSIDKLSEAYRRFANSPLPLTA
jgi:hypothetical protein